jgi:hypothetical protein
MELGWATFRLSDATLQVDERIFIPYFSWSGEGGSCPAFQSGESLTGNDSLEAPRLSRPGTPRIATRRYASPLATLSRFSLLFGFSFPESTRSGRGNKRLRSRLIGDLNNAWSCFHS